MVGKAIATCVFCSFILFINVFGVALVQAVDKAFVVNCLGANSCPPLHARVCFCVCEIGTINLGKKKLPTSFMSEFLVMGALNPDGSVR